MSTRRCWIIVVIATVAVISLRCSPVSGQENLPSVSQAMRSQVIVLAECQTMPKANDAKATYKILRVFRCTSKRKLKSGDTVIAKSDFSKHPYSDASPSKGTRELLFLNENKAGVLETLSGANGRWPPKEGKIKLIEMSTSIFGPD